MAENRQSENFLIFDFETGGLSFNKNPALEFAGIWLRSSDLTEISRYEAIIRPWYKPEELEITQKALDVNGLKMDEINNGVYVQEVVQNILKHSEEANKGKGVKKCIMVGHNVDFDIGFMHQIFIAAKMKDKVSKAFTAKKDYFGNLAPAKFDTQYISRARYADDSDKGKFSLGDACNYEAVELFDGHRAMNDVIATKELFVKYLRYLRSQGVSDSESLNTRHREGFKFNF